jgi:hypothetical protein
MRRLILPAFLSLALLLTPAACRQHRKRAAPRVSEDTVQASMINVYDPRAASQILQGFYPVEGADWRWTQKAFSVSLGPPRAAAQQGAQLELDFAIADAIIQRLKSITLSASITGLKLAPQTYTTAGQFTYIRDVPADRLRTDTVPVEFTLDKALPPSPSDSRELGLIVTQVGLKIK